MIKATVIIISIFANFPCGDTALMEAVIHIDSDNFRLTSFFQRFKRFIAKSHSINYLSPNEIAWYKKFIHHNDSFHANYDFSRNLLTMSSSYSLLMNGTNQKISDIKITVNFRYNQETNGNIILEDMQGNNVVPQIEYENHGLFDSDLDDIKERENSKETDEYTILERILSPIVYIIEPIVVSFIHIIVNGVLGHVLTTAFDQLYNGRLITI